MEYWKIEDTPRHPELMVVTAAAHGHIDDLRLLIAAKANVNRRWKNAYPPLYFPCREGHAEVAGMLVDAGADYNNVDNLGTAAMDLARRLGHLQVVEILQQRIRIRESK